MGIGWVLCIIIIDYFVSLKYYPQDVIKCVLGGVLCILSIILSHTDLVPVGI